MLFYSLLVLLIACNTSNSRQKKVEEKAKQYLIEMYKEQNFDLASKDWHDSVLVDFKGIYKRNGTVVEDDGLINQIKNDFNRFYKKRKNFEILNFESDTSSVGNNQLLICRYTFKEEDEGHPFTSKSYIYFVFDKQKQDWKVWDFRVPAILGDSTEWMK